MVLVPPKTEKEDTENIQQFADKAQKTLQKTSVEKVKLYGVRMK